MGWILMFYTKGENELYEIFDFNEGKKINVYLEKEGKKLLIVGKPFGTHILEQIFDREDNLISQKIKVNPYKVNISTDGIGDDYD